MTSSKLVEPGAGGADPGEDPWKAIVAAEHDRNLSDDKDDDDSTSVFSLCTKVGCPEEDADVKSFNKFFFN